jgi:hypothetical protein
MSLEQSLPQQKEAEDAVDKLFEAARLPQRLADGLRAWCLCRGGAAANAACGPDAEALACTLLRRPVVAAATVASTNLAEEMISDLGLKLVESLQLQKALQSQVAASTSLRGDTTTPKDAASATEQSATEPLVQPSSRSDDAVGSFFEAARLPPRHAYTARAWCLGRGGAVAAAARGSDTKALACALRATAGGRSAEEMIEEVGLKFVQAQSLRKAVQAAAAAIPSELTTTTMPMPKPAAMPTVEAESKDLEEMSGELGLQLIDELHLREALQATLHGSMSTMPMVVPSAKENVIGAVIATVPRAKVSKKRLYLWLAPGSSADNELMRACKAMRAAPPTLTTTNKRPRQSPAVVMAAMAT